MAQHYHDCLTSDWHASLGFVSKSPDSCMNVMIPESGLGLSFDGQLLITENLLLHLASIYTNNLRL